MATVQTQIRQPRWYWIPVRVLLVTFLLTLLAFAVSLLLGILGLEIGAKLRGAHANVTVAYRYVAPAAAAVAGAVALLCALLAEIRHYRQTKVLAEIERVS